MPDDFRIIKITAASELQTIAARHALCGQIVNGFCVESVGFCEPVHVEDGAWVSRCYVEGRRVDVERAPVEVLVLDVETFVTNGCAKRDAMLQRTERVIAKG